VEPHGIHHLGMAVDDLDGAVDTYERLFGARLEHRETVEEQGVEAASLRIGSDRVELLASLGDDTPSGGSSRTAGRGCTMSPSRSTTSAPRSTSSRRRARADRRAAAAGLFGLQVAFVHPEAVHGVLAEIVSGG
jgi:methylmalonyl-CoA/ethylmalonyl-CoA epimerase